MAPFSVGAWYQYVPELDLHDVRYVHLGRINTLGNGSQEPELIVTTHMQEACQDKQHGLIGGLPVGFKYQNPENMVHVDLQASASQARDSRRGHDTIAHGVHHFGRVNLCTHQCPISVYPMKRNQLDESHMPNCLIHVWHPL